MNMKKEIEKYAKQKMENDLAAGYDHFKRVYEISKTLSDKFDDEVLHAVCFLHDIALDEPRGKLEWRGAEEFLKGIGFPKEKLEAVKEAVINHVPKGNPKTKEGILLHDADLIDLVGATGVVRLSIGAQEWGFEAKTLKDVLDVLKKFRRLAYDNLILDESKKIVQTKVKIMDDVIKSLEKEIK